jgi:hypothetical protein
VAKVMPDGPLCSTCRSSAIRRRGPCASCGRQRLLPGQGAAGHLCCSCAGIDQDFTCGRCGTEWALRRGLCEWCVLGDTLDGLLEGDVDLSALRERLLSSARPDHLIIWLYRSPAAELLAGLAAGTIALTHQGLDGVAHRRAAEHLRGLLVAVGLLPERDERLARFDRWVCEHLAEHAATAEDLKVLSAFATWGLRRHLVTRSEQAPVRDAQLTNATQKLRVAAGLLVWLRQRGHELEGCTQADLDEWFATPPMTHVHASPFLRWAIANRRCPRLRMPARKHGVAAVLDHGQRLDILARLLDPSTGRLEHRVGAMVAVLLGQPFTRIAALGIADVVIDGDDVGIRLGQGITPIPPPFAGLVVELLGRRPNLNTATNPTSPWLFPGRTAGNHLRPDILRTRAMQMGIDLLGARSGALRQLVLDCPPAVVADMLGYSYQAIDRHARRAGSPWSSYAALRAERLLQDNDHGPFAGSTTGASAR